MEKAFAYLRVSTSGQVKGHGFDRQLETIESYCQTHDIELVKSYREEGISGTTSESDRPAFQDMIAAILKNGVRTVIVEGLDRLAREYRIQETLLVYLASKGITLINARTEENVTEAIMADPMKKALIQIQGVFAELEKNLLTKKLRAARDSKREANGKCEGRKSYQEAMPEVVKEVKRLRRARKGMPRRTFKAIADSLNGQGVKSMTGKDFSGSIVQSILNPAKR